MNNHFSKLKQNLEPNPSFDQTIQTRHAAVRSALENKGATIKDTKLIGSLQRKTRIQPRIGEKFDIDILVVLGEFYNWLQPGDPSGVNPQQALSNVYGSVKESDRYSTKNPEIDAPTVTLEFTDGIKVELVPAYLDMIGQSSDGRVHSPKGRAYWVPKGGRWELADYDFEADYITEMNEASDGYLVPTIKMLKAVKRLHFPYIKSFPLEIIAAQTVPNIVDYKKRNNQTVTYSELIKLFCVLAKDLCAQPIQIPGSNSPAIALDQVSVQLLTKKLNDIVAHITAIDSMTNDANRIEAWKKVFGDVFPTTVLI